MDSAGNLYGTTFYGGNLACDSPDGYGTVFKLDTTGNETVLHTFTGGTGGDEPYGGLVMDSAGNLYGTTSEGGVGTFEYGTVFKLILVTATTTTLTSSPNPSTYGEAVTFTAVVAPAPPDGESVSFMKGKTVLGTGTIEWRHGCLYDLDAQSGYNVSCSGIRR
jgi:uncharacterized repeat protein (TIGR03803 family)